MAYLEQQKPRRGSSTKTMAIVVVTIVGMWLLATTIHRLAALITYVVVFAVGYLVGRATD